MLFHRRVDAGWYCQNQPTPATDAINSCWTTTGNWSADPDRFNGTLRPVSDAAHAAKLKLLVWFEPERVSEANTQVYNTASKHGWLKHSLFNYAIPAARKWMTTLLNRTIVEYGIDIYRQDANLGYYYACWSADEADDRRGMTEAGHVEGSYAMMDELRASHPELMMDTCASGGRRIEIETLRRMAPLHRTDWEPSLSYSPAQAHNYGLSLWVPVRRVKALFFCACRSFSLMSPHLSCYTTGIQNSAIPFAYRHKPSFMCSLGACGRSTLIHRSNPLTLAEH